MGLCCWSRNIQVPKKWAFSSSLGKGHAKSITSLKKKELFQAPQSERPRQEWKATPRTKSHTKSTTSLKKEAFSSSTVKDHAKNERPCQEHNKSKKKELFQAPQSERPCQEWKATPRMKGHAKSTTSLKGHWACRFLPFQMRKWLILDTSMILNVHLDSAVLSYSLATVATGTSAV